MHSSFTPTHAASNRWQQPLGVSTWPQTLAYENGGLDVARVVNLKGSRCKIKQGECVFRQLEHFHCVCVVLCGSFKSTLTLRDGGELVSNFHFTGALLGLDGMAEGYYASTATALEDSEVAMLPYSQLLEHALTTTGMQTALLRQVSSELVRQRYPLLLLGHRNARQRLAGFLLHLSEGMDALGYSALEFHLKMTRHDIGSFLGLTLETVSRTFSELQHMRLLTVQRRHIHLRDLQGLAAL